MSERANDPTFSDYKWTDHEREYFQSTQGLGGDQSPTPSGSDSSRNSPGYPQPSAPRSQDGSPDTPGVKSWNDITTDISRDGGYHFTQDDKVYYRQGDRLYRADQDIDGYYSVKPIPGNEAGKIHDREILANGQPVYARNKVYYHHEGTVYGADKRADGSPRLYSLSPHEDEDVYAIAKKPGRSEGTAVDAFNPVEPWGGLATRGPLTKRLGRVAFGHVKGLIKPYF